MNAGVLEFDVTLSTGEHVVESVLVESTGSGRVRVVCSPAFITTLVADDEIQLTPSAPGYRVLRRGGNVGVRLFVREEYDAVEADLGPVVGQYGGWVDGLARIGGGRVMVFTLPLATSETAMEQLLRGASGTVAATPPPSAVDHCLRRVACL